MGKPTVKLRRPIDHCWWGMEAGASRWFPTIRSVAAQEGVGAVEVAQVMSIVADRMGV
jgi:hypothetical protein